MKFITYCYASLWRFEMGFIQYQTNQYQQWTKYWSMLVTILEYSSEFLFLSVSIPCIDKMVSIIITTQLTSLFGNWTNITYKPQQYIPTCFANLHLWEYNSIPSLRCELSTYVCPSFPKLSKHQYKTFLWTQRSQFFRGHCFVNVGYESSWSNSMTLVNLNAAWCFAFCTMRSPALGLASIGLSSVSAANRRIVLSSPNIAAICKLSIESGLS